MTTLLEVSRSIVFAVQIVGIALYMLDGNDRMHRLYHEIRPFYQAAIWLHLVLDGVLGTGRFWLALDALNVVLYWYDGHRNCDDDRWKRRRQAVKEKVTVVRGRLVVAPAGGAR